MRKSLKRAVATVVASAFALTLAVAIVPTTAKAEDVSKTAKKAGKAEYDPEGTYHAYFGLQQSESWIFRNPWYGVETGLDGTSFAEKGGSFQNLLQSNADKPYVIEGPTITDAEITGNGVYSVSIEGLDGVLRENMDGVVSMIYVSTDIPTSAKNDGDFAISDAKLFLDDMEVTLPDYIFYEFDEEFSTKLIRFDVVNSYQKDQGAYPESPSITPPTNSIRIQFTVSGMANDNPDAVEPTPAPAAEEKATSEIGSSESGSSSSSGGSMGAVIAVVAVIVVVGAVVIVMKKKNS